MKKGVFLTLRFKSMFGSLLIGFLIFSALFLLVAPNSTPEDKLQVNLNTELVEIENKKPLIIVDPGHGGEDGGTASSKGTLEKDVNLAISLKVNAMLKLLGFETVMTRTDDTLIYDDTATTMREKKVSDIRNRMRIIEENPNSIFLSIHQNYFTQSKYSGAQVFYSQGHAESMVVAESLQQSIIKNLQPDNTRKIKKSGDEIYLLHHANTPAVMVECGFMSNPGEALLLTDEVYQRKMALAIVGGITDYLKNKGE